MKNTRNEELMRDLTRFFNHQKMVSDENREILVRGENTALRNGLAVTGFPICHKDWIESTESRDVLVADVAKGRHMVGGYDTLANVPVLEQLGAHFEKGVNWRLGDMSIEIVNTALTATVTGEVGAAANSEIDDTASTKLVPKRLSIYSKISRPIALWNPIMMANILKAHVNALYALMEKEIISGDGSGNHATGLLYAANVNSVACGTNGAAVTWANVIAMEKACLDLSRIRNINATGYLSNSYVRAKLAQTEKVSTSGRFVWENKQMAEWPALISDAVPHNLTKGTSTGVCSALLFGDYSALWVAVADPLDILMDFSTLAEYGWVRLIVNLWYDFAISTPTSFCKIIDALTT